MPNYQFRPLEQWPGSKTSKRKRATFSAGYQRTLDDLERELRHLNARGVVIQAAVDASDIRNDGMLRSTARPSWPGVILSFESMHGPLSYPCDTFEDWKDNLRAIALALAALRAVNRYGVTKRAEQYKGWARLPPPSSEGTFNSPQSAAEWLANELRGGLGNGPSASAVLSDPEAFRSAYRIAAMKLHPDQGGDEAKFKRLQYAVDALNKHHGL